jgi:hypothetical protein
VGLLDFRWPDKVKNQFYEIVHIYIRLSKAYIVDENMKTTVDDGSERTEYKSVF